MQHSNFMHKKCDLVTTKRFISRKLNVSITKHRFHLWTILCKTSTCCSGSRLLRTFARVVRTSQTGGRSAGWKRTYEYWARKKPLLINSEAHPTTLLGNNPRKRDPFSLKIHCMWWQTTPLGFQSRETAPVHNRLCLDLTPGNMAPERRRGTFVTNLKETPQNIVQGWTLPSNKGVWPSSTQTLAVSLENTGGVRKPCTHVS